MAKISEALGMIETKGFVSLLEASDDDESSQRSIPWLG